MIKRVAGMAVMLALSAAPAFAQTIYPIDRADILAGAKFDFKVELPGVVDQAKLKVTLNGADYAAVFGQGGTFTAREAGQEQSALLLRDVSLAKAGQVAVEVSDGTQSRTVTWTVYDTGARKARNVILFIGDGMSPSQPAPYAACRRSRACRGSCPPQSPWKGFARRRDATATSRRR